MGVPRSVRIALCEASIHDMHRLLALGYLLVIHHRRSIVDINAYCDDGCTRSSQTDRGCLLVVVGAVVVYYLP
jgi:hypothetical protein